MKMILWGIVASCIVFLIGGVLIGIELGQMIPDKPHTKEYHLAQISGCSLMLFMAIASMFGLINKLVERKNDISEIEKIGGV